MGLISLKLLIDGLPEKKTHQTHYFWTSWLMKNKLIISSKTTSIYQLNPTIGYNAEVILVKWLRFNVYDIGNLHNLGIFHLNEFMKDSEGVILVLNVGNRSQMVQSKTEVVDFILDKETLQGIPLLLFAVNWIWGKDECWRYCVRDGIIRIERKTMVHIKRLLENWRRSLGRDGVDGKCNQNSTLL